MISIQLSLKQNPAIFVYLSSSNHLDSKNLIFLKFQLYLYSGIRKVAYVLFLLVNQEQNSNTLFCREKNYWKEALVYTNVTSKICFNFG